MAPRTLAVPDPSRWPPRLCGQYHRHCNSEQAKPTQSPKTWGWKVEAGLGGGGSDPWGQGNLGLSEADPVRQGREDYLEELRPTGVQLGSWGTRQFSFHVLVTVLPEQGGMTVWKLPPLLPQTHTDGMLNGGSTPGRGGTGPCDPEICLPSMHLRPHICSTGVAVPRTAASK